MMLESVHVVFQLLHFFPVKTDCRLSAKIPWGFGVLGMWRFKEKGKDFKGC